jgi:hypothetical protein
MTMARETAAEKAEREAQEQADAAVAAAAAGSDTVDESDGKGGKVKVDQNDGEIVLTRGGEVVLSKKVVDGHVTASDDDELAVLLASVPGATRVEG